MTNNCDKKIMAFLKCFSEVHVKHFIQLDFNNEEFTNIIFIADIMHILKQGFPIFDIKYIKSFRYVISEYDFRKVYHSYDPSKNYFNFLTKSETNTLKEACSLYLNDKAFKYIDWLEKYTLGHQIKLEYYNKLEKNNKIKFSSYLNERGRCFEE
jgi:hypothetical protein